MEEAIASCPGEGLKTSKMPGHWVLARLGKRVLRPGGVELTREMLASLSIGRTDDVVEFAPGLGVTARITLAKNPASYTAVERDEAAARGIRRYASGPARKCIHGTAEETGLPARSSSVVYGEAMLTMQPDEVKRKIVREAARLLRKGGRYGIHEMSLTEGVDESSRREIHRALTSVVHHGVRPLTVSEWRHLLESEGLRVESVTTAPMHLLEPARLLRDEGIFGALRFVSRAVRDRDARRRVLSMRRVFRAQRRNIAAVAIVAVK